jgi:hypothetical protein
MRDDLFIIEQRAGAVVTIQCTGGAGLTWQRSATLTGSGNSQVPRLLYKFILQVGCKLLTLRVSRCNRNKVLAGPILTHSNGRPVQGGAKLPSAPDKGHRPKLKTKNSDSSRTHYYRPIKYGSIEWGKKVMTCARLDLATSCGLTFP